MTRCAYVSSRGAACVTLTRAGTHAGLQEKVQGARDALALADALGMREYVVNAVARGFGGGGTSFVCASGKKRAAGEVSVGDDAENDACGGDGDGGGGDCSGSSGGGGGGGGDGGGAVDASAKVARLGGAASGPRAAASGVVADAVAAYFVQTSVQTYDDAYFDRMPE